MTGVSFLLLVGRLALVLLVVLGRLLFLLVSPLLICWSRIGSLSGGLIRHGFDGHGGWDFHWVVDGLLG